MLDRFAKLLGIRPDQAEEALRSERAAKHVVSRRSFFGAAGALATGAIFSFGGVVAEDAYEVRLVSYPMLVSPTPHVVTFDSALKRIYTDTAVESLFWRNDPLLTMLEKARPLT